MAVKVKEQPLSALPGERGTRERGGVRQTVVHDDFAAVAADPVRRGANAARPASPPILIAMSRTTTVSIPVFTSPWPAATAMARTMPSDGAFTALGYNFLRRAIGWWQRNGTFAWFSRQCLVMS